MTIEERSSVTATGLRKAPWGIRLPRLGPDGSRSAAGRSHRTLAATHDSAADSAMRAGRPARVNRARLTVLLLALVCTAALAFHTSTPEPRSGTAPRVAARPTSAPLKTIPAVRKLDPPAPDAPTESAFGRNPFKFADEPAAPPIVAPPPLPPPPPPVVSPESRFIGTVYRGGGPVALFLYRNDVIALRQEELLENRYVVRKIEPESVVLEDRDQRISATFSIARK